MVYIDEPLTIGPVKRKILHRCLYLLPEWNPFCKMHMFGMKMILPWQREWASFSEKKNDGMSQLIRKWEMRLFFEI